MKSISKAATVAMVALTVLGASAQTVIQRPKLTTSPKALTKPDSTPKLAVEAKNIPAVMAGKAPVIDLGLADGSSEARDINESGMALVNNIDKKTCFVWTQTDGFRPVLPEGANFALEGDATVSGVVGRGLNNKGQVAGNVILSDQRVLAFLWDAESGMRLLGTLAGGSQSVAIDVSDNGIVAGTSLTARSKTSTATDAPEFYYFKEGCAFAWAEDLGMVPIGRFGTMRSWATAINSKGVIAGAFGSHVTGTETTQSFLWSREEGSEVVQWHFLYNSGDRVSSGAGMALDIRDDNTLSMFYYHYSSDGDKPYPGRLNTAIVVRNGHLVNEFKTPGMDLTYTIQPLGLNDSTICVGYQRGRGGKYGAGTAAFAWRPGAEIADLNVFSTGWDFVRAYRINSKNQIVGIGTHQGKTKGFIMNLSPTLLPTSATRALTKVNDNTKLGPLVIKPPKLTKPPKA